MSGTRRWSLDESDVNKWGDVMQSLPQSSVILTFLYIKRIKTVN